jgi:hypothetical protein
MSKLPFCKYQRVKNCVFAEEPDCKVVRIVSCMPIDYSLQNVGKILYLLLLGLFTK